MAELTIAAGIARGLMRLAVSKGADATELAARSGVYLDNLEDPDARVPFPDYVTLMRAGQAMTGDPALALHYAEAVEFSEISIVGLLGNASETMLDAFGQMNRFGRLAVEYEGPEERFQLSRERDGLWLVDMRLNPNAFHELTETTFGRMAWGSRFVFGTPFVLGAEVTHADPGYACEYERVFGCPVAFGAPRNAVRLSEAWATHRLQLLPRYVFGVLSEHAQALLKSLEDSKTTRGRVEALLMPILHTGEASMDVIAGRMGLSRQTLFRRLKAEDVTFERVLDELRHKLALHYLSGQKVSVNETAYLVGFSDPAAFSRAFKRWTGTSPGAMRALAG